MRKLIAVLFVLLLPLSGMAWIPFMYYYVTPHYAQVQVVNNTAFPAYCQGYVYGTSQFGVTFNSWFSSYVYPMSFQYAYVFTNYPHQFVNAWANIYCQ